MTGELQVRDTIPEKFKQLFPFERFNRVQSAVLPYVLNTDENIVVCAPTASGKTVIAELAMIKQLNSQGKTLYLGPLKALTYEKEEKWGKIFNRLGYRVYITTGDEEISPYEANASEIIVSTPEKWDSASRKWNKRGYHFVNDISLLIIDEVHLLDSDSRGGVLEAIVFRMRRLAEVNQRPLRIIALSATMSNYREVAEWIGAKESFTFCFDSSARPVPLTVGVYPYKETGNKFYNMYLRLYKALDLTRWILEEGNQVLIFVASRRDTRLAAKKIAKVWEEQSVSYCTPEELAELRKFSEQLRSARLREVFTSGVAFHHAGLSPEDRSIVESCFRRGLVKVLVSTSTLAWGVNLPAKAVVIRDTYVYDTLRGEREINPLDIIQMLGRAGRPQYDDEGIGWVIVRNEDAQKYRSLIFREKNLESRLLETLPEHLNAEIVLGTVRSEEDALNWVKTSFLYIREKNRRGDAALEFLENEIRRTVQWLENHGFLLRENGFKATKLAEIACNYYLDLETAELFHRKIRDTSDEIEILSLVSRAKEFKDIVVRRVEKKFLKSVLSTVAPHLTEGLEESQKKVLAILLSYLQQVKIMEDLRADSWIIKQNALRLLAALGRLTSELGANENIQRKVKLLSFKLEKGVPDEQVELIQVPGIGPKTVQLLLGSGINSIDQLLKLSPYDLTRLGLSPKTAKRILEEAKNLPKAVISLKINKVSEHENITELLFNVQNKGKPARFQLVIRLNGKELINKPVTIRRDAPWTLPLKINLSTSPVECEIHVEYLDLFRTTETLRTIVYTSSQADPKRKLLTGRASEASVVEKAKEKQQIPLQETAAGRTKRKPVIPKGSTMQLQRFSASQTPAMRKEKPESQGQVIGRCKVCAGELLHEENRIFCKECGVVYKLPRNAVLTSQKCDKCGLPKFRADYVFPILVCIDRGCENADEVIRKRFDEMKLKCPNCGGALIFLRRRGLVAGCENYYKGCKTAFKLPTTGVLLDQRCPRCGLPLVKLKTKTRCLNTECTNNQNKEST
nr:DEAD/DEAH box helicase [Candidatus Sigynarchaeota archaeon]